jgi:hypothetical protein
MFSLTSRDTMSGVQLPTSSQWTWTVTDLAVNRSPVTSREAMLQWIEAQHYATILTQRIQGLPLPGGWTSDGLLAQYKHRDQLEPLKSVRRRLDETAADINQARQLTADRSKRRALVAEGRDRLREELRATRSRVEMLTEQRWQQHGWATTCALMGNLPAQRILAIERAYAWENAGYAAIEDSVIPRARTELRRLKSRKDVDDLTRRTRRQLDGLTSIQDRVLNARERVIILIDSWNCDGLEQVYTKKAWLSTSVPMDELSRRISDLELATSVLRRTVTSALMPGDEDAVYALNENVMPLARGLFEAQRTGEAT